MKKDRETQKSSPILAGLINAFFDLLKHLIKDFDNMRKVKKIDKFSEEFSTIEHMMIKLEKKLDDNRHQIEELKTRLIWGNIIIIILILLTLFHVIT